MGWPSGWPIKNMTKIMMLSDVNFAHRGVEVVEYKKGQSVETYDTEFVSICLHEKWARETTDMKPKSNKAHTGAPETK